jgi:hypothetical protein
LIYVKSIPKSFTYNKQTSFTYTPIEPGRETTISFTFRQILHIEKFTYKEIILYYNYNMRIVDTEREKEWDENMNTILVVVRLAQTYNHSRSPDSIDGQASLFAAFLSAFLVETTKLLREDPNDTIKLAIIHLSAQYNRSAIGSFESPPFQATANDILVNSLLLTSLALNLVAVVVAMLVKQWNREFDRGIRLISDPKHRVSPCLLLCPCI